MILYHVTNKSKLEKITETGLKPIGGFVYFTNNHGIGDVIQYWVKEGPCVIKVDIPKTWILNKHKVVFGPRIVTEYRVERVIPSQYFIDVFCVEY